MRSNSLLTSLLQVLFGAAPLLAQVPALPDPPPDPTYTLHANTRVVLTDVTVTDNDGNPVRHLKPSDFKIIDNSQPETIASFEEHTPENALPMPHKVSQPGLYTNDYLIHPPPAFNIILIDTTLMSITDEMYLHFQLARLFNTLPAVNPVAIYLRSGLTNLLMQSYTSDRAPLLAALDKAIPHLRNIATHRFVSERDLMGRLIADLGSLPGRKNVLWFSAGYSTNMFPPGEKLGDDSYLKPLYDELERCRIALYPIDIRGPIGLGSSVGDYMLMESMAQATGGRAFYANNGLEQIATHVVSTDADFYTLTYTPRNFVYDSKWHKVKIEVAGQPYKLSYRRGYFADKGTGATPQLKQPRKRLVAGGNTTTLPSISDVPLVFQAVVRPSTPEEISLALDVDQDPSKHNKPFTLHFAIPASELSLTGDADGTRKAFLEYNALVLNQHGTVLSKHAARITLNVKGNALKTAPDTALPFSQQIDLGEGDLYLTLAIQDLQNRRLGTLQIPLHIPLPPITVQALGTP